MDHDPIDQVLARHFARHGDDDTGTARVLAKLEALPPQKHPTPWPQILLDWQFSPAWPRLATLACCGALGFVVGTTSIDRLGGLFAPPTGNDLVSIAFEPEAITGLRP